MKAESNNISIVELLDLGKGFVEVSTGLNKMSANKSYLFKEIKEKDFEVDFVYFSGDFPTIYYKSVSTFDNLTLATIRETHRKIWNQGKVAFLYVEGISEFRIYNCFHKPINPHDTTKKIDDVELIRIKKTDSKDLEELLSVFGKISIESGQFWENEKYATKLHQKRVNEVLIDNLKQTRRILSTRYGIKKEVIHDLLLRSLFILYLEDRGATDKKFYSQFSAKAESYYDILASSLRGTYKLFAELETSFNGNLSPVTENERKIIKLEHLQLIRECFWDKLEISGQQKLFDWKVFDFKYIPIELLSEIYEDFLKVEEGEEKKSDDGAYYTPHTLVEFILNKVLPWGDKRNNNYNIKILDPTCGSGIFLVESFKRLADRWEYANPGRQITFTDVKKIVKENIFGIEYNSEAIKVAAFSLYLAMLDKLEPKTLWKDRKFPYLIYDPNEQNKNLQGGNLFLMSSLGDGPFTNIDFDLIVGNPPFKEGNLDEETKSYVDSRGYPQEKVIAFLDRALTLCPNGRIALVAASKAVLFNTLPSYQHFRKMIFSETYVEEVYNFSILRKTSKKIGGNLFASAVGPACILFYQRVPPKSSSDRIVYCAPKTTIKNNLVDAITIESTDIKYLPRIECKNPNSKIWKIAMWGTERDFKLIQSFTRTATIKDRLLEREKEGWAFGRGFETSSPCDKPNSYIKSVPHIEARKLERYSFKQDNLTEIEHDKFRRIGAVEAYKAPHILIKAGQKNKKFCAAYTEIECSFRDAIYGIHAPNKEKNLLKALTAFLNSSFASYYLFLSSSSWGIEREKVMCNETLSLPASIFDNENVVKELANLYNAIKKNMDSSALNRTHVITDLERKIDELVFDLFNLNEESILLINDVINYNLDLFNEGNESCALKKSTASEIKNYAKELSRSINKMLSYSDEVYTWAQVYDLTDNPLQIIALKFNNKNKAGYIEEVPYDLNTSTLLNEIEKYSYKKFSESVYFRKTIKYSKDDTLYIIKPNEKRYWSRSIALSDSDEIVLEVANS
jgi:hypothetical protein